jgi:DNA-binding IclR family transcriptional regulator
VSDALRTLDRAFAILGLFTHERPEWTTTELARASALPLATTHRILASMAGAGYLAREARTRRWRLGPVAERLGETARARGDLHEAGIGVLRRVSRGAGVTAMLWVLGGRRDRAVCVGRVEDGGALQLSVFPGFEQPLHAGASRKVLLAHLAEPEIDRVAEELPRLSRGTITDRAVLRDELRRIRDRGFGTSFEETDAGAWGVAVPILDGGSRIVASLGVAAPTARYTRSEVAQQVRRLTVAARELRTTLGYA